MAQLAMRHSIATVSLSGGLQDKLYAIAAAKFDLVEIFENELAFFDGTPADLRELAGQLNLGISLFQPFFDFEAVPDEVFAKNLDRAARKFDLMLELGAPMMLVSSNASAHAIADDARAAAQLRAMAESAAQRGLKLGYEAVAWGAHVKSYHDAWRIVAMADHPSLGLILDSFHTLAVGDDPAGFSEIPAEKLFHLQLSDAPRLDMDVRQIGRHFRCLPGQGNLDIAGFTAAAIRAGYDGPLSIEVFNDELRAAPNRQSALEAKRSLLFVEEGARPLISNADRLTLIDPPPPPKIEQVAFVEFAVDAATGKDLHDWLTALGFARIGTYQDREVDLYRQGRAHIVLNASPDSFAHYYHHLHGPSVCAIGLQVRDRDGLLARADAFSYKRHAEQPWPDGYQMLSLRAPDGSLIPVVDSRYDPLQDFVALDGDIAGAGVQDFDHIARAVPAGQFDSWVLYNRALLGLTPEATLDLPDPHGLVRSMAMSDAGKHVRFPLSFSDSNRTVVARSLTTFAGAGVNQIAFSTDDIFATVTAMRARGARLLPIPASYYVELGLETDLSTETVGKLRDHQLLYASDGAGGEFLQAYTETFQDRFFFEVVQRLGGYDRYGEGNAPVRMAAQAKRRKVES
jgi:4-hydroxyphenylpyruvate dioxygenase